jgi:hypothetical protein
MRPVACGAMISSPRKTASANLLQRAVSTLGPDVVASALGLDLAALEKLRATDKPMNLAAQSTLALAIFAASDSHPELRRKSLALLAQVRAAADFESGVTERHTIAPAHSHRWE